MNSYDFKKIESKWQKIWEESGYGQSSDFDTKPKHYHLVEFPYPSGSGLHVGHCMGYGASDAYSRMKRMQGFNVMYPMGWDAFGLPTENYAIKNKVKPQKVTEDSIVTFKRQMKSLAYSFDWDREVNTADPAYYKWTQWIFLQFYKHGYLDDKIIEVADDDTKTPRLAYQAEIPINWCPSCKIGLANEEVIAGKCERCGTEVIRKVQKQWMLRITSYAERLIKDLDTVDYLEKIKTQQINWIGKSEGANVEFKVDGSDEIIEVFTTRADTLFGATYVVLAPEHPLVEKLKSKITNIKEVEEYIQNAAKKSDLDRTDLAKDKNGIELKGIKANNPINNERVSVWIADYCLANYGTGAVMAVPAHDQRDFEFAKKYGLDIKEVIIDTVAKSSVSDKAFADYGKLVNSDEFNDLTSEEAKKKITEKLIELHVGDFTTNYKLRDWVFSRQHYWGEPIPIVHCEKCGVVPLDEKDLPLELPDVENYEPSNTGESPLATISDWVNAKCPKCGGKARRETDTMPNWAGSSWYFLRYCSPQEKKALAAPETLDYWLPVDLYNGGMEHTTLHLLYSRFWHKFLFDLKVVPNLEPYQKRIAHGIILGPDNQKMSKSRGNVINPDEMVKQFGADTLRAYIMFIGPYDGDSAWSMNGIQGVFRFLKRVWNNFEKVSDQADSEKILIKLNQTIAGVTTDLETFQMNTVLPKLMELNNLIEKNGTISKESYKIFLQLLYPACPHITEELWQKAGFDGLLEDYDWPKANEKYLIAEKITIAIQINGKTRDTIEINATAAQNDVEAAAKTEKITSQIAGMEIVKVIYVAGRIVNFVVK